VKPRTSVAARWASPLEDPADGRQASRGVDLLDVDAFISLPPHPKTPHFIVLIIQHLHRNIPWRVPDDIATAILRLGGGFTSLRAASTGINRSPFHID
jgi:hypothetical protein